MHFFNPAPAMKLVEVVVGPDRRRRPRHGPRGLHRSPQAPGGLRGPGRVHRERAAVPVPQQRDQDGRGALRLAGRHRRGDEAGRRLPDGTVRTAGRRGAGRLARDREGPAPRVPRPRGSLRRRCWSTWWPRAASAARRAVASANMPVADPGAGWGGLLGPSGSPPAGALSCTDALRSCHVQPAKSPRATAAPDAPETAAGTRAAAQRLKMRRERTGRRRRDGALRHERLRGDDRRRDGGRRGRRPGDLFRHFRSKEEAIFPDHDDTLVRAEAVLNAAPRTSTPSTRSAAASRKS
ncbi:hypothetical protein SMICM17S_00786 [Streptomyces microflavus]